VALIGDVLFPPADYRRTTTSILTWWESRRLLFNGVVGASGLFTLAVVQLIAWLPPGVPYRFAWQPVVAYGVMANVCYTFGWALEALAQRIWKDRCPPFGPALFRQGLAFSVGLTLLPVLIISVGWVARTLMWVLR
jgi:hypothetical protein